MTTSGADVLAQLQVACARLHAADPVIAELIDRRPDYDPRHRLDEMAAALRPPCSAPDSRGVADPC